jgi:hypothetical protein
MATTNLQRCDLSSITSFVLARRCSSISYSYHNTTYHTTPHHITARRDTIHHSAWCSTRTFYTMHRVVCIAVLLELVAVVHSTATDVPNANTAALSTATGTMNESWDGGITFVVVVDVVIVIVAFALFLYFRRDQSVRLVLADLDALRGITSDSSSHASYASFFTSWLTPSSATSTPLLSDKTRRNARHTSGNTTASSTSTTGSRRKRASGSGGLIEVGSPEGDQRWASLAERFGGDTSADEASESDADDTTLYDDTTKNYNTMSNSIGSNANSNTSNSVGHLLDESGGSASTSNAAATSSAASASTSIARSYVRWISAVLFMGNDEVLASCGTEGHLYLYTQMMIIVTLLLLSVPGLTVLLPINLLLGQNSQWVTGFGKTTALHLGIGNSTLWVHCIFATLISAIAVYLALKLTWLMDAHEDRTLERIAGLDAVVYRHQYQQWTQTEVGRCGHDATSNGRLDVDSAWCVCDCRRCHTLKAQRSHASKNCHKVFKSQDTQPRSVHLREMFSTKRL